MRHGELLLDPEVPGRAHGRGFVFVGQQLLQPGGHQIHVARIDDVAGHPVHHHLRRATEAGGDHRLLHGHRLDVDQVEWLTIERWCDADVREGVRGFEVLAR